MVPAFSALSSEGPPRLLSAGPQAACVLGEARAQSGHSLGTAGLSPFPAWVVMPGVLHCLPCVPAPYPDPFTKLLAMCPVGGAKRTSQAPGQTAPKVTETQHGKGISSQLTFQKAS